MAATFLTAFASFASTNIDDIFVLMILYAQTQNRRGIIQIIIGQYLGIGCLTALSILGALGTQVIPSKYIGLLGVFPLILGVRAWITYHNQQYAQENEEQKNTQISLISVALLTMANGADNIGYIFRR